MKYIVILLFLLLFPLSALPQKTRPTPTRPQPAKTVMPKLGTEAEELAKATALAAPAERLEALQNFLVNFPGTAEKPRVEGLLVATRADLADQKLQAGATEEGLALFKTAVAGAPAPLPEDLYARVLAIPFYLFQARQQRAAAFDVAKLIEEKAPDNPKLLLDLARFFIKIEYGTEAIRLARRAVELAPQDAAAHQTLGDATRLNFQLEDAAASYAKAIELDAEALAARQSLGDLKRALGKPDEAAALYREILAKQGNNPAAQAGLVLALFDAKNRAAAEAEMNKALAANPNNFGLMVGVAYWYAARGESARAIELAEKAKTLNPAFIWSYIAHARALLAENKPLEAERVLLVAKQYGDFPTLDYELASARMAAGLYREAAESLKKNFAINKDGLIETYLGNRILADAASFTDLLSLERRAAIYETSAADTAENAERLKLLLNFAQKLDAENADETELSLAADDFVGGADNMRLHRQLFAASRLLQKKAALPKVLELTREAVASVDTALSVPAPSAAVLADEIYASRQSAIARNQIIVVPEIPRQTLQSILRGRIEEIAGWTFFQQSETEQSVVRFKRALSVLPEKSAWWRSSQWRLGSALAAQGKDKEALDAYIKGYNRDEPDAAKRLVIEGLYVKVNGSLDGLEARIGAQPESPTIAVAPTQPARPNNTDNVRPNEQTFFTPSRVPVAAPTPESSPAAPTEVRTAPPETAPEPKVETEPTPQATPESKVEPTPETKPEPTPEASPVTETAPQPTPSPVENAPTETPTLQLENPTPTPAPSPAVEIEPAVTATPQPSPETTVTPEPTPAPTPEKTPEPTPQPSPEKSPETTPTEPAKPTDAPTNEPTAPVTETKTETKPETNAETKPSPTPAAPDPQFVARSEAATTDPVNRPAEKKPLAAKAPPKPVVVTTDNLPTAGQSNPSGGRTLFEPVVISVAKNDAGRSETAPTEKRPPSDSAPTEKQPEAVPAPEKEPEPETKAPPAKPLVTITDNLPPAQPTENKTTASEEEASGEMRPRVAVVVTDTTTQRAAPVKPCRLSASQETLSILADGGMLGVFVGFLKDSVTPDQISALSSSPADIEVTRELGIGENAGRAFFIIRSVSAKTGAFTVTFEAPCGKKEILVKVR